jgi:cytochrome c-type biogenesis protein CcmH
MIVFWVAAGALTAAVAALILMRAAKAATADSAVDPSAALYRRQLSEIDELADRGLMGEAERKSAHAEAARRLLAATDAPKDEWAADPKTRKRVLLAVVAVPALTLGLYLGIGAPGFPDQPYAQRLAEWRRADLANLNPPEIAAVLRDVLKTRPDDAEGYRMLAMVEAEAQNMPAAVRALRRAVALAPERNELRRMLGEALVFQSGGKVEADAEAVFAELLRRDPGDAAARFYLAQAKAERGRGAEAAADLRALMAEMPAGDERRPYVEAAIAKAEGRPALTREPSPELDAIRGMVASLAAKLEQSPDDAEGWVRLVRSYSVLGDTAQRDAALTNAKARFADRPDVLKQLDEAARAAPMP